MSDRGFRISVHKPFHTSLKWVSGLPDGIKTHSDVASGYHYPAIHVPAIVAALKLTQPADFVVTVY